MIYLDLFLGFLKVGCFSFGGAYAAIPLIRDVVLSYGWMSDEAISYMIGISESTPGPIMINMATFVGSEQGGILGALIATFAVALPSFIIILLITAAMNRFLKNRYVQSVMNGLKPCVAGVILAVGAYMVFTNLFFTAGTSLDLRAIIITVILAAVNFGSKPVFKKKLSPITFISISAALGMLIYSI